MSADSKYPPWIRAMAWITIGVFAVSNTAWGQPIPGIPKAAASSPQMMQAETIEVPEAFGILLAHRRIPGSRHTVILIQDAHAVPDAQRNIQKLIEHFQRHYGVRVVALEGAASRLDSQIFRSFPDQNALKGTLEAYLENGELTGGAAAAILNREQNFYFGVEDWELYEQGIALYLAAMNQESES